MTPSAMTRFWRMMRGAGAAQADGKGQLAEIVAHEHDIGGFQGDCGAARAHRHADRGGGQCGRIVHAVADHRDDAATVLEFTDQGQLVSRQQLRADIGDSDFVPRPDGPRRRCRR